MKRIMFVDDDANVLAGLRNSLRGRRAEWTCVFALGPEAAYFIEAIAHHQIPRSVPHSSLELVDIIHLSHHLVLRHATGEFSPGLAGLVGLDREHLASLGFDAKKIEELDTTVRRLLDEDASVGASV